MDWTNSLNQLKSINYGARQCGSILPLKFGKDIPLNEEQASGLNGNWNITFNLTITNISTQTVNYDCYMHFHQFKLILQFFTKSI